MATKQAAKSVSMEGNKKKYKTTRAPQYHTAHNIFVHPKIEDDKKGEKERNIQGKKRREKTGEKKTKPKSSCMRSGRKPSPEGTRLPFAGTISSMICPVDGPTGGRHKRTRQNTIQEEGRDMEL